MVSCDMQTWMRDNVAFRHFTGIVAFFLLFTVLDQKNHLPVRDTWIKTFIVYVVFVMMTKSKWYFSLPVLLVLVVDQTIRAHVQYLQKTHSEKRADDIRFWNDVQTKLNYVLAVLIVSGAIHYAYRQRKEFKEGFTWSKFMLTSKCNAT